MPDKSSGTLRNGYLSAISLAEGIGAKEVVALLQKSLAEERAAEQTLRKIASGLLKGATATAAASAA